MRKTYHLEQPDVHAAYRNSYAGVDTFNKLALGPRSVQYAVATKCWHRRVFLSILTMCETNAYLAYSHAARLEGRAALTRIQWKL